MKQKRKLKQELGLRQEPSLFRNRDLAFSNLNHCVKSSTVILGDDNRYWVVLLADAQKLYKLGYEYAI